MDTLIFIPSRKGNKKSEKKNQFKINNITLIDHTLKIAKNFGANVCNLNEEDPLTFSDIFSRGRGVDAVIVTTSTKSDKPIHQAAQMCRKRARIVLVGVTGLKFSREDFFKKELTFQVSASYGPGRYDPNYEEKGHDYPLGFVRWTAQRNFEAVLDIMASGALDVKKLISHEFDISEANKAYDIILGSEPSMGILLSYPGIEINNNSKKISLFKIGKQQKLTKKSSNQNIRLSFLGAGNYATSILIPAFKNTGSHISWGGLYGKKQCE